MSILSSARTLALFTFARTIAITITGTGPSWSCSLEAIATEPTAGIIGAASAGSWWRPGERIERGSEVGTIAVGTVAMCTFAVLVADPFTSNTYTAPDAAAPSTGTTRNGL